MIRQTQGESHALGLSFPVQSTLPLPLFSNLAYNFNKHIINRLQNDPYHNVKYLGGWS